MRNDMVSMKTCGIGLITISTFLITFFLLRKNETFFNLRDTIISHLRLFRNCKLQYIVFYILPLVFSVGLAMIYVADESFYSQLIVVIGILVSMQYAMLSILCGYNFNEVKDQVQRRKAKKVVKETVDAIVFDCVLCVGLLLYGLAMIAFDSVTFDKDPVVIRAVLAGTAYYILTVILLTLLLIVKHMSKIIEFNLSVKTDNDK